MTLRDWLTLGMFAITLLLVPLVRAGWRGEIAALRQEWQKDIASVRTDAERTLALHNEHVYSHPNLAAIGRLEKQLDSMTEKLDSLLEKVGQIMPRTGG